MTISPELAVGYLIAKFSGKVRQPLNMAVAALLSKLFPALQTLNSSALLGAPQVPNKSLNNVVPGELLKDAGKLPDKHDTSTRLQSAIDFIRGPIDKFGFSYFLASKLNVVVTICGSAAAIHYGVDLNPVLSTLGMPATIQSGVGAMAAATLTNVGLLPFQMFALTALTPTLSRVIQKSMSDSSIHADRDNVKL
jgi:hypothetical protein